MRGERADYRVVLVRDRIVDQQAAADAAVGRFAPRREQKLARGDLAEVEVLRGERALRPPRKLHSQRKAVCAVDEQAEAGQARMPLRLRLDLPPERERLG